MNRRICVGIIPVTLFLIISGLGRRGTSDARAERLDRIVLTSEAVALVCVEGYKRPDGRPPDDFERVMFRDGAVPNRAGGHLVFIQMKEKPVFVDDDEVGRTYYRRVLSPSLEVAINLFQGTEGGRDSPTIGRLWASYRNLDLKALHGLPTFAHFGLFGGTFEVTQPGATVGLRAGVSSQDAERLWGCQTLVRFESDAKYRGQRRFFSLPMDLSSGAEFEKFFGSDISKCKQIWSSYRDGSGDRWLIWVRPGPQEDTVEIYQCRLSQTRNRTDGTNLWLRLSPVESAVRKVGDRHTVSSFSFRIAQIGKSNWSLPFGWIHIADPEVKFE